MPSARVARRRFALPTCKASCHCESFVRLRPRALSFESRASLLSAAQRAIRLASLRLLTDPRHDETDRLLVDALRALSHLAADQARPVL